MNILNYGGGTQTVAMVILVANGVLPKPDRIIIADTGREVSSTWRYLDEYIQPFVEKRIGMRVEIASHDLATVDLYSHQGVLLLPAFTKSGKLSNWCSNEWKARVVTRYIRQTYPRGQITNWIGFSLDEVRRVKGAKGRIYPLIGHAITRADCERIIATAGLPQPRKSRCWCCPNQSNEEWRSMSMDEMTAAIELDEAIRAEDIERNEGGFFLHHSRQPLADADFSVEDRHASGCQLGLCFI